MQGFNMGKYVPPDQEGVYSGNALNNKHPLGSRASKPGLLTVRFEMPFPIWCTSCPKPTIIGQGVRFNAQKARVGKYYSTPIFSFRMKHVACGAWIEIRTDPKNTAYVVHEGARKRDTGENIVREGDVQVETLEEKEVRRADAFANLEGRVEDKKSLQKARERLEELREIQDSRWEDPYTQNRKLRAKFRIGRKQREEEGKITKELQDKMSLGIRLLPETEEDARRARYVDFGNLDQDKAIAKAISKPLFGMEKSSDENTKKITTGKLSNRLRADKLTEKRKLNLAEEVRDNTRAKTDPFIFDQGLKSMSRTSLGIKRKRPIENDKETTMMNPSGYNRISANGLVDYESD